MSDLITCGPQVSVQQVISPLTGFVLASLVLWAPTSLNRAECSASPVEEAS